MVFGKNDKRFDLAAKFAISIFTAITFLVVLLVVMVSITDESAIVENGYSFFPEKFSLDAYKMIFNDSTFSRSMFNSLFVTIFGTVLAVLITALGAYGLAHPKVRYKAQLSMYFYITMVFTSGLVPWYLICNSLNLKENYAALIVPKLMFSVFNLFLVRNYMAGIDKAIMESAIIDGAGDFSVAFRIYLPISKPVLATVALFYSIDYWNDWYNAVMLVPFKQQFYPLQYLLFKLQNELSFLELMQDSSLAVPPAESFKMAMAICTMGPIILFYPFLQRYIIKGIVMGAVKG